MVAATQQALALCEELGHQVELISCPVERQVPEDFMRLWGLVAFLQAKAGRVLIHRGWDSSKVEPWTAGFAKYFSDAVGPSLSAIARLRRFTGTWATLMEKYDVLISPTLAEPPVKLGHLKTDLPFEVTFERVITYVPFTAFLNAAGAPIGVQFAGAFGAERLLLELGRAIEEARPGPQLAPRARWR